MSLVISLNSPGNPFSDLIRDRARAAERGEASRKDVELPTDTDSPHQPIPVPGKTDRTTLIAAARHLQRMRKIRSLHLPDEMFGEAAWDIMLGLYVEEERRPLPITGLAWLVNVPLTTALKCVIYLEDKMLVRSVPLSTDARVRILELTEKGREAMDDCMAAHIQN